MKTLNAALPLAMLLLACGSPSSSSSPDPTAPVREGDTPALPATPAPPAPPAAPTPVPTPAPAPAPAIPTAKVHSSPVWDYAVANDAVWVATGTTVERTAPDGTTPTPVTALTAAASLATDGTRVYAMLDKGYSSELFSVKIDGTDGAHHLSWSDGNTALGALTVHGGRVYFTATNQGRPVRSMIVSAAAAPPAGGTSVPWRLEEYVDAQNVPPAFVTDRFFAVDYYRQSAVRVSVVDTSASVDVIAAEMPLAAGGIAANATDVFTRTSKGIVRVAIGSGPNTEPVVVVASATCSIFDPADGSPSVLEDALVVEGTSIYTACRAGTNVEVRAYDLTGKLSKVIATAGYNGGLTRLRVTSTAVYWLSKTSATSMDDELWRAAK